MVPPLNDMLTAAIASRRTTSSKSVNVVSSLNQQKPQAKTAELDRGSITLNLYGNRSTKTSLAETRSTDRQKNSAMLPDITVFQFSHIRSSVQTILFWFDFCSKPFFYYINCDRCFNDRLWAFFFKAMAKNWAFQLKRDEKEINIYSNWLKTLNYFQDSVERSCLVTALNKTA